MEPLSRIWLILASVPRSWLAFGRSCMAMVSLPRSCHDLGKDTMASNTGYPLDSYLRKGSNSKARVDLNTKNIKHLDHRTSYLVMYEIQ